VAYSVAYIMGQGKPKDGDQLGSGRGWLSWVEYAISRADDYPTAAQLAEDGWVWPVEKVEQLARELHQCLQDEQASADVKGVTRRLLAAVRLRPEGTTGVLVTDGTEGGEGES
jgi:hypothetical protein